jgi:hypothetical protein
MLSEDSRPGEQPAEPADARQSQQGVVSALTDKLVDMIASQLSRADVQGTVKRKVVTPLVWMVYRDVQPYLVCAGVIFVFIFVSCLAMLAMLVLMTVRTPAIPAPPRA